MDHQQQHCALLYRIKTKSLMKVPQLLTLVGCVLIGSLWTFIGQNLVLLTLFEGLLSAPGMPLDQYVSDASSPSFRMLWLTCIIAILIWCVMTTRKSPINSAEVRKMRPVWWIYLAILVGLGCIYQLFFTVFQWQLSGIAPVEGLQGYYFPIPPEGWIAVLLLVIFDVGLLFWLPTMLATPKSYRFVVPGAIKFKFIGGR